MPSRNKVIAGALALAVPMLIGYEGYKTKPYRDVGGVWTDCYGETTGVKPGVERGREVCEILLGERTKEFALHVAARLDPLPSPQTLAAFTSWTYNVGKGAFDNSTLRRKWNAGDLRGACQEMARWVYVKGVQIQGLANRRVNEVRDCIAGLP